MHAKQIDMIACTHKKEKKKTSQTVRGIYADSRSLFQLCGF